MVMKPHLAWRPMLALLALAPLTGRTQVHSLNGAINKAGRQRMLQLLDRTTALYARQA